MSKERRERYNHKGQDYEIISQPQEYNDPTKKRWGACGEIIPREEKQRYSSRSNAVEFFDTEEEACEFFIQWAKKEIDNNNF